MFYCDTNVQSVIIVIRLITLKLHQYCFALFTFIQQLVLKFDWPSACVPRALIAALGLFSPFV